MLCHNRTIYLYICRDIVILKMKKSDIKLGMGYCWDSNTGITTCNICGQKFETSEEAMSHFDWSHPVESAWLRLLSTRGNLAYYCRELCPKTTECLDPTPCPLSKLHYQLGKLILNYEKWVQNP